VVIVSHRVGQRRNRRDAVLAAVVDAVGPPVGLPIGLAVVAPVVAPVIAPVIDAVGLPIGPAVVAPVVAAGGHAVGQAVGPTLGAALVVVSRTGALASADAARLRVTSHPGIGGDRGRLDLGPAGWCAETLLHEPAACHDHGGGHRCCLP
jgi:hypothetical protein